MGDAMTTHERAELDNHITGGGSPGIIDEAENFGAPILLAWTMLDKQHSPLAAAITEAVNKAVDEEGYRSITAITLLKNFYKSAIAADAVQKRAYEEFTRGWVQGVDAQEMDAPNAAEDVDWENEHFSYMLGHLSGDFAYNFNWATPYEKDSDEADEADIAK
jgi:hypothetical protein